MHDRTQAGRRRRSSPSPCDYHGRREGHPPRGAGRLDHLAGQPVLRQELRQPALGLPARRRDHRADRRHPRRQPAQQSRLLDYLTARVHQASGFDVRHVMQLICKSRTYQLSVVDQQAGTRTTRSTIRTPSARRLPAEVLYDAVYRVTGLGLEVPRRAARHPGGASCPTRASSCPSGFLATFGRPARESACECERIERPAAWARSWP